jgi:hypothetical protein
MLQQLIDMIGKLGPLAVAIAVFIANRSQTKWANDLARRTATVEDQKFRLALLDRRMVALEKVSFAVQQFWSEGAARQEAAVAVNDALRIAELVFEDTEKAVVEDFLRKIQKWQSLNRRLNSYRDSGDPRFQATCDEIFGFEDSLTDGFAPVLATLREAIRVRTVPPVNASPSWRSALIATFRK